MCIADILNNNTETTAIDNEIKVFLVPNFHYGLQSYLLLF